MGLIEDHVRRTLDPLGVFENFVWPLWLEAFDWVDRQVYGLLEDLDV